MKILHVHDFFAPGNSRYGHDICRTLVKLGHEVHVLAGVGELGPRDGEVLDGVTLHTYPYGFGLGAIKFIRHARRNNRERFGELHARIGFDLILFNQPLCCYGVTQHPDSRPIPKVYSFISPWKVEWEAAQRDRKQGWFGAILAPLQKGLRNRMEGRALNECHATIVMSRYMKQLLHSLHPEVPDSKLHLIPGGVDEERFRPGECRTKNSRFTLLTVRRLVPRMGIENLLGAMEIMHAYKNDVRLIIGGDGPERNRLELICAPFKSRQDIDFRGYVPDDELPELYRSADLFVLPTRELEGFGLVMIEAMACGTPVMGTPVGAIPEVLSPLDPDLVFKGTGHVDIVEGIQAFMKSARTNTAYRENCRKYVLEHYRLADVVMRIESVFMKAVEKARAL